MLETTLTFRVHQNAIQHLNRLKHLLHFESRSDMIRMAIIEAVYYTMHGKLKLRGRLVGKTKVIGCRLPENIHRLIIGMNSKQRNDTISVWAALAAYDWIEQIEKQDKRNLKSNVYPYLCKDFTRNYRPHVERLLMEIGQWGLAK
ncbi:hypothetical protein ES703_40035 [subsurface metagenome]